ncbi:MAG: response regulator [Candidatus Delongbacteria bacterium]|jgi:chemotaxis family two-component system response regulator Rcp1|nr:response regulator [Candidatus Delongbacteria bacterium]
MTSEERHINILLIEDNEGDAVLAREAFRRLDKNINLTHIYDGEESLQFLDSKILALPDLIILDLNLPGMNGFEILKYIKESDSLKELPVVIFSTSNNENDITKCKELKADSYIIKPIDLVEYFNVVEGMKKFWIKNS